MNNTTTCNKSIYTMSTSVSQNYDLKSPKSEPHEKHIFPDDDWKWIKSNVEDWDMNPQVWDRNNKVWNPLQSNIVKNKETEFLTSYEEVD